MKPRTETFYLVISAGTGPIEAQRFAALLAERLTSLCTDVGLEPIAAAPRTSPDHARVIELGLSGERELIQSMLGSHALLLDARRHRSGRHHGHRKRWFVQVTLRTVAAKPPALDLRDVDLQFARSGGPGGQHVNTASTAVRAVHRPTGIAVRVTDSRSQAHNRELALERLAAKLQARADARERIACREQSARELAVVRGDPVAVWSLDAGSALVRRGP